MLWRQDVAGPQHCSSSPSSEVGLCEGPGPALPTEPAPDNPLLAPPIPPAEHPDQSVRLLPSGGSGPGPRHLSGHISNAGGTWTQIGG